ncbi:hypothetical protein ACFVAD_15575 [Sutcliffiella sp. NPDC057660]|uniref:hypothetical protein n=1 Tax=Sutcliffiella sp. NPDC057660 TaxID=3346199 RepID=UPI0036AE6E6E
MNIKRLSSYPSTQIVYAFQLKEFVRTVLTAFKVPGETSTTVGTPLFVAKPALDIIIARKPLKVSDQCPFCNYWWTICNFSFSAKK